MSFRVLIMLVLIAALTPATKAASDSPNTDTVIFEAVQTQRVPPRYPAKAIERNQEGWVDLTFTITPEGTTSGIRVVAEYPRHVFARSAMNAVAKWTYKPRLENGVAVPQDSNHAVLSFALTESTAIQQPQLAQFTAAEDAIDDHKWDAATQIIDQLAATETLNLFELATLEALRGRIAFGKHAFAAAEDSLSRALEITTRFDAQTRYDISEMLVMAAVNNGEFARALRIFDHWNPPPREENRELRHTVEAIRAALGADRAVNVAPLEPPDDD